MLGGQHTSERDGGHRIPSSRVIAQDDVFAQNPSQNLILQRSYRHFARLSGAVFAGWISNDQFHLLESLWFSLHPRASMFVSLKRVEGREL